MDIIGEITLPPSKGRGYVVVITYYFTKWVEFKPFKTVKTQDLVDFLKDFTFVRFGVLESITVDQAPVCNGLAINEFTTQYEVKLLNSSPYYAQANGTSKGRGGGAIAYTPYQLVFGHDAVIPAEVNVESARILHQNYLDLDSYSESMNIVNLDVKHLREQAYTDLLKIKIMSANAYNVRVKSKTFQEGDLVWK
ncbi:uncharacterized protein LOC141617482 [Silene latifolia]|uniref:uncharacterized protein LOC141617482 n=1 Tax=Silene latifolia TaxID=37657 RepID=UPI003D7790BE